MKNLLRLMLVLLFSASMGWTQQALTGETNAGREDVLKLFDVMHLRDQMKLVMGQVSAQMKSMSHDQLRKRDPHITDEEIAKLDA